MVVSNNSLGHGHPESYDLGMPIRRERRVTVPISVRLWGLDRDGKVFSQNVKTLNIATSGARLFGVTAALERGFIVGLLDGTLHVDR